MKTVLLKMHNSALVKYAKYDQRLTDIIQIVSENAQLEQDLEKRKRISKVVVTLEDSIKQYGSEHTICIDQIFILVRDLISLNQLPSAEVLMQRCIVSCIRTFGSNHAKVAKALQILGDIERMQNKYSEAETYYKESLLGLKNNSLTVIGISVIIDSDNEPTVDGLAFSLKCLRKFDESEILYKYLLTYYDSVHGRENPIALQTVTNIAEIYLEQEQYEKANELCESSLDICMKSLGADDAITQSCVVMLAQVKSSLGQMHEAESMYHVALQCNEKQLGLNHPETIHVLLKTGELLYQQGDYKLALQTYDDGLMRTSKFTVDNINLIYNIKYHIALTHYKLHHHPMCKQLLLECLHGYESLPLHGKMHPLYLKTLFQLGKVYQVESLKKHEKDSPRKVQLTIETFNEVLLGYESIYGCHHESYVEVAEDFADFLWQQYICHPHRHQKAASPVNKTNSLSIELDSIIKLYGKVLEYLKLDVKQRVSLRFGEAAYKIGSLLYIQKDFNASSEHFYLSLKCFQELFEHDVKNQEIQRRRQDALEQYQTALKLSSI